MTTVVHGIPQALVAFERRKIAAKIAEPIAAKAGGSVVQQAAKATAPKHTGALAASIVVEVEGGTAHVGPTVDYARFPNFGTRYIQAQHFMEEAASGTEKPVELAMAAIFKLAMR